MTEPRGKRRFVTDFFKNRLSSMQHFAAFPVYEGEETKGGADLEDQKIIALYWKRSEQAIQETDRKYGGYCYTIAEGIIKCPEDAQEVVSDTYFAAWNTIPPQRPHILKAFLARITRNLSIDRWNSQKAGKRGGGEIPLALEELSECIPSSSSVEREFDAKELEKAIDCFARSLGALEQRVFLCRYWYLEPIDKVAERFGCSHSKITSMLHRTRKKLRKYLEQEGLL